MRSSKTAILITILLSFITENSAFSKAVITDKILSRINTPGDELSATLSLDKKTFIFSRKEKNTGNSDLYIMEYENGKWTNAAAIDSLNSSSADNQPFIANEGNLILFSSNRKGSLKHSSSDRPSYDIYFSEKKNNVWEKPALLFGAVNTTDDEINPSISRDGKYLYFTRRKFNDEKSSKIVRVKKINGLWEDISTVRMPSHGYTSPLLFSESYTKRGFYFIADKDGSRNIYFTATDDTEIVTAIDNEEKKPGEPLSLCEIDGSSILISSSTEGEDKNYDFSMKRLSASVKNRTMTGIRLNVSPAPELKGTGIEIKFFLFEDKKAGSEPLKTVELSPDSEGRIDLITGSGVKRVIAIPGNAGVQDFVKEFIIKENTILSSEIKLRKGKNTEFSFRPLYFSFNSSHIRLEDIPYLHRLVEYMRNDRSRRLLIKGYADGVGSYRSNINLSIRRAAAVKKYLIGTGIKKNRFRITGMGFKKKSISDTPQHLRRVEFSLIK